MGLVPWVGYGQHPQSLHHPEEECSAVELCHTGGTEAVCAGIYLQSRSADVLAHPLFP